MNEYTAKRLEEFDNQIKEMVKQTTYGLICEECGGGGTFEGSTCEKCEGHGIHTWRTNHLGEKFKLFLSDSIAQAEQEGYERGKLSEIENSAVGDIKIVSDKVEQIKAQAEQEMLKRVEQKLLHQKECIFLGIQKEFIKKALSSHRQRDY